MSPLVSLEEVKGKIKKAKQTLKKYDLEVDVTADDLIMYFQATTSYDIATLEDVLENPFLVIHELVELHELKKRGLKITKDIIIKNIEVVYEAHLIATEIELSIAYDFGALQHIRSRIRDIKNWLEDPLLPKRLYKKCSNLLQNAERWKEKLSDV